MSADRADHGFATAPLWTSEVAAAATAGRATAPWQAFGVSIDSRTLVPGDLFVALVGPRFDGHDFVAAALAAGAAAAVVHRVPHDLPPGLPLLVVGDTFEALTDLGQVARMHSRARVVAVTGSVGKTGTKEALIHCLAAQGPTHGTLGSLNNHWGVPLTLARMPDDTAYGVFELGMNHAGEINALTRQVKPDVGVITTVAPVHLEFFPSVEAIAEAKAELFDGMTANGTAVLNRDNPHFARLVAAARTRGLSRIRSFGRHPDADARLTDASLHATSSAVTATVRGRRLQYGIGLPGEHWVVNSLAVLLAVDALGADVIAAAGALGDLTPIKGRGVRRRLTVGGGAVVLIDESYNASPVATEAALQVLARNQPGPGGRRIAVLGDMLELGREAVEFHAALAEPIAAAAVDLVFTAGPLTAALDAALPAARRGGHAADAAALAPIVTAAVRPGDVVLVKGSAGSRMAVVVAALAALGTDPGTT